MTTHRLRHTYATTLLSGGMSLVGLMRLLGHRSYKTTLRYAAVTQETIGKQYFEALLELDKRYQLQLHRSDAAEPDPLQMLSDVVRWIDKHVAHDQDQPRTARRLTKRIERVRHELRQLLHQARHCCQARPRAICRCRMLRSCGTAGTKRSLGGWRTTH